MSRILRLALASAALLGGLFVETSSRPAAAQTASKDTAAALPPDFRGRITYQGSFTGRRTIPRRPLRRLDLESLIRTATSGGTESYSGDYWGELQINGSVVTGRLNGTGLESGTVSGTRSGNRCRLLVDGIGASIEGECTATRFAGRVTSPRAERRPYTIDFDAQATRLVDAAEEERERQLAAEAAQQASARTAASRPAASASPASDGPLVLTTAALGITLDELMNRVVYADSRTWHVFEYVRGSMRNARYETGNRARTTYIARGEYSYLPHDGAAPVEGWARLWVRNGEFGCIEFHDVAGDCRPLNQNPSQMILGAMAEGLMNMSLRDMGTGICARVDVSTGIPVITPRAC